MTDNYPGCPRNPLLTLAQVKDIKAALTGQRVLPNGTVDHSSPTTTPWLQLHVVTYASQLEVLERQPLIEEGVVDGISFWISGSRQASGHMWPPRGSSVFCLTLPFQPTLLSIRHELSFQCPEYMHLTHCPRMCPQDASYEDLTALVRTVRTRLPPAFPVFAGGSVDHAHLFRSIGGPWDG